MKSESLPGSAVFKHRENLKRLVRELSKRPFSFLPERSVECLHQFFAGYEIFGPPMRRDLSSFQHWLKNQLFYPNDTGAVWWRFIQLNAKDSYDSYELFFRLYSQYLRITPTDMQPTAPEYKIDPAHFDFYKHLYSVSLKPGLYLGCSGERVELVAAYLAGYFKGKNDVHGKLTRDEKTFLRFEEWLHRDGRLPKKYSGCRILDMWRFGGLNSFESFFANYDAYLTDYGKKARGLEDLFEAVSEKGVINIRRRPKLPSKVIQMAGTQRWWRWPKVPHNIGFQK